MCSGSREVSILYPQYKFIRRALLFNWIKQNKYLWIVVAGLLLFFYNKYKPHKTSIEVVAYLLIYIIYILDTLFVCVLCLQTRVLSGFNCHIHDNNTLLPFWLPICKTEIRQYCLCVLG